MPAPKKITPSYLRHSQSGRARAVWTDRLGNRHDRLLPGPFDSPESRTAFAKLLLELEAAPAVLTMAELLLAFLDHAQQHYRGPDGKPTNEVYEVKVVVGRSASCTPTRGSRSSARSSSRPRQKWVKDERSRTECNRRVGMVKRIFKWAVSEQLAPPAVYQAIATVTGLQKGRTTAHETEPVEPVEDAVVDATLPFLTRAPRTA